MELRKSDGTVVADNIALETIEMLNDNNMASSAIADMLKEQGICWMFFGESDQEVVKVRTQNMRSALTAATDFLFYKKYSHKLSTDGLHINTNADLTAPHAENIGVIRSSYVGNLMQAPSSENGVQVWNQVGRQLDNFITFPIQNKQRIARSTKHDFVEYLIRGYALQVWIAPIREYAATFVVQWLSSLEDALQFRSERLTASRIKKQEIRPAGAKAWKATEAANKAGQDVILPDDLFIKNMDGEAFDLLSINEDVKVKLYLGGMYIDTMRWTPGDKTRILTFADILARQPDYKAEVLAIVD